MTVVTLEDGSCVDLENIENIQNQNQSDAVSPIPQFHDNLLEYNRPCDRVHVYDYYKLGDSVDEAPPAYCRVEKLPPVYVESDLSCSREENLSSHKPLQVQTIQQDYDPFVSFQIRSFQAYNPSLKRKFSRRSSPSCLRCWMLREKCVGDLPCDRCIAKDRSTTIKFQPCVAASLSAFDFSIFYPHLQTQTQTRPLDTLYLPAIQHDSTTKDVSFSEMLHHKAILFRLLVISTGLAKFLKQSSKSNLYVEFPVSSTIIRHLSQLDLLEDLISTAVEHASSVSDYALTSMLVFTMLEARAIVLHNLLKALEKLMKLKLRSAPSDAPDLFCAFLLITSSHIELIGETCEAFISGNTRTALEGVAYPSTTLCSLIDHLCRWLQFFSLQISERRGHTIIFQHRTSVEARIGTVLQIGSFEESAGDRYQNPRKLTTLHDIHEMQGAGIETIDIWTGNAIGVPIGEQQGIQNVECRAAEAIDGLVEVCCGPLKSDRKLELDLVTTRDDSSFDFISQSLHRSQISGNEGHILDLCGSELLEFPKFIAALSKIFDVV